MLTPFTTETFEFVSVSLVLDYISTSTVTAVVCMLQSNKPMMTVVVELGTV